MNPPILWCARLTVIFGTCICQTFLPYTTALSTPLSDSICCGTRGWRNFHDLQLINKATTYNTFLGEVNPPILWCARLTVIFGTCICQTFLPYTTALSTPLSDSICCGTRGWRNFHDLQLINKATTYNTFLGEVNPPILWCARLAAIFTACKCQRFSLLIPSKKAGTALMHDTCFDVCIWIS